MIFKVYYLIESFDNDVHIDNMYFESMQELVEYFDKSDRVKLVYAKEMIGSEQINEFRERYM